MARYRKTNFAQNMLVSIDLKDQLMKGTIESVINDVIDRMDMQPFEQRYCNDNAEAPAYDPGILLKIILYGYSRGLLSSRRIAKAAETNIIFIALSGYSKPDFTTIADFISSMSEEIQFVFLHVLRVCNKMKLIVAEKFAIDGHKVSSNAAKECSGTFSVLKYLAEKNINSFIPDPFFRKRDSRFSYTDKHKGKTGNKIYQKKIKHKSGDTGQMTLFMI